MKKKNQEQGLTINRIYLGILGFVTVVFVIALAVVLINSFGGSGLEQMKTISAEELQSRKLNNDSFKSFYVLVYTKDNDENEMIASHVKKYNNYVKTTDNEAAYPVFVIEYTDKNAAIIDTVLPSTMNKDTEFPCLITIVSNSISNTKTTVSTILQTLEIPSEK